jgi:uncharacterized protein YbaP (TraB family)
MLRILAALLFLATTAKAEPALWVAHGDAATVYLFGTVHVLPPDQKWLGPHVSEALGKTKEIWTEANISDLSGAVKAIRHYGLGPAHGTEKELPVEYRARYLKQATDSGLPAALVSVARPWLAEILLGGAALRKGGALQLGVEAALLAYAHDHHVLTPTFETLDEQFAILSDMPEKAQITSLEQQIDEFDGARAEYEQLLAAWLAGDVDKIDKLTNQEMRAQDEMVWTELILRRNERFAQKISDRLQGTGVAFVAVGAAHLVGSTGVPALLRNYGFTVERVK